MAAKVAILVVFWAFLGIVNSNVIIKSNEINQPRKILDPVKVPAYYNAGFRRRCPVCDSSVFSYCSDKLLHDSCCCYVSTNPYDFLPHECQYADCSFLHANSCVEHKLITACCCI